MRQIKFRGKAHYINEWRYGNDIVQGVDLAINKTIYDLVYERKTEKDYESAN